MRTSETKTAETSKKMAPKKKAIIAATIAIAIIVVAALIYLSLPPNSPLKNLGAAGIYDSTDADHTGSYIELRSDGNAFVFNKYSSGLPSSGYDGSWELRDGNRIYLTLDWGFAGYLRIDGNNLITEGSGEVFTKRGT